MDRRYNAAFCRLTALLLALALLFAPFYAPFAGAAAEVTAATVDYASYALSASPSALNITYYTNIYSRGFAWATDTSCNDTELFIVQSALGENAQFDESARVESAACSAETVTITSQSNYQYIAHKAHVTDLAPGGVYSYKLGGNGHYLFGTFTVAPAEPQSISVLTLTDAQTRVGSLLYKWENCVAAGFATVHDVDFVLYGGDQYDVTMNNPSTDNSIKYILRYGFAKDTIASYLGSTPYMAAQGNHDNGSRVVDTGVTSDIAFAGTAKSGYYSFDYGFAHFAVINTNDTAQTQVNWLQSDLSAAKADGNIKWIIVLMHNGPHSTGDHSADSFTAGVAERFTEILSQNHVDLVLQGHDHTYSKTLPYRWDTAGRTTVYGDENAVNYSPATVTLGSVTYDLNPQGTYYVTTGASGHRAGPTAGESDGVFADVTRDDSAADGSGLAPVNGEKTFLNNTYKTVVGTCNAGGTAGAVTINAGDPATGNVDAQMFGALYLTEDTLQYKFYTVEGGTVKLFDTLNVLKSQSDALQFEVDLGAASTAEQKRSLLERFLGDTGLAALLSGDAMNGFRAMVRSIMTEIENGIKTLLSTLSAGSSNDTELFAVQYSVTENAFNARFIAATAKTEAELEGYKSIGFLVSVDSGGGFGAQKEVTCRELYTASVLSDGEYQITNAVSPAAGEKLFALTLSDIPASGTVRVKIVPFMKRSDGTVCSGAERTVTFVNGFYSRVD